MSQCQFVHAKYGQPGWLYDSIFQAEAKHLLGAPDAPAADADADGYAAAEGGYRALARLAYTKSSSLLERGARVRRWACPGRKVS